MSNTMPNDHMDQVHSDYVKFLIGRIENAGGSLQFQHLTGHLSQLPQEIRKTFGTSKADLMKFLRKNGDLFKVDGSGIVTVINSSLVGKGKDKKDSNETEGSLPPTISDGLGIVTRVFPAFGFITTRQPIKTSVYFTAAQFDEGISLLTDLDIFVGLKVGFEAKRGHSGYEAKYRATKVWKLPDESTRLDDVHNHRKNHETGLYDPLTLDSDGTVKTVFNTHGFIMVKGDAKNTVYFHLKNVCGYDNLMDLNKVLKVGDKVEFSAVRSLKKEARARWAAIKVWVKKKNLAKVLERNGDIHSDLNDTDHECRSGASSFRPLNLTSSRYDVKDHAKRKDSDKAVLQNQDGKIYPHSSGVVIKFGQNMTQLADGDSCDFYIHGTKVQDISWEFSDGDNICFDVIKVKSDPGWKALLGWVGEKPTVNLLAHKGDLKEFTDGETDDLSESGSYTSKTSGISMFSETSYNSSRQSDRNASRSTGSITASKFSSSTSDLTSEVSLGSVHKHFSLDPTIRIKHPLKQNFEDHMSSNSVLSSRSSSKSSLNSSKSSKKSKYIPKDPVKTELSNEKVYKSELKSVGNWGDSPYPDEEIDDDLNMSSVSNQYPISSSQKDDFNQYIGTKTSDYLNPPDEKSGMFYSDEEFTDASQEISNIALDNANGNFCKSEEQNSSCSRENLAEVSEIKPYIKCFKGIDGKVIKVYCRYGEIYSENLQKPVAFFWNDMYRNGVSVEEHFDDLKEVVKIGDIVQFDCFEIIDDSGHCWQKVTLVWRGQKPIIKQMSPSEFIKQHDLKVTATEQSTDNEKSSELSMMGMRLLNVEHKNESLHPPKFLSLAYSNIENEEHSDNNDFNMNFCSASEKSKDVSSISSEDKMHTDDGGSLLDVIRILKSSGLVLNDSKVDINALSKSIINVVQSSSAVHNSEILLVQETYKSDKGLQTEINSNLECPLHSKDISRASCYEKRKQTSKATQTIITGEVIAQSIFTQ